MNVPWAPCFSIPTLLSHVIVEAFICNFQTTLEGSPPPGWGLQPQLLPISQSLAHRADHIPGFLVLYPQNTGSSLSTKSPGGPCLLHSSDVIGTSDSNSLGSDLSSLACQVALKKKCFFPLCVSPSLWREYNHELRTKAHSQENSQ